MHRFNISCCGLLLFGFILILNCRPHGQSQIMARAYAQVLDRFQRLEIFMRQTKAAAFQLQDTEDEQKKINFFEEMVKRRN